MLAAEKANLLTTTAVDTLQIREKEMTHYINTLATVSTQATLLAGFAFAQLTGYEYIEPEDGFLSYETLNSMGIGHAAISNTDRGIGHWTWYTWLMQIVQLVFVCSTGACMFFQLWTVQKCTGTSVLGQGLALRGREGSVDRAIPHMARQSEAAYALFSLGIVLIKLSTMLYLINAFSVVIWVPCALICGSIAYNSNNSEEVLRRIFTIPDDETVSSALFEHRQHHKDRKIERRKKRAIFFQSLCCCLAACARRCGASDLVENELTELDAAEIDSHGYVSAQAVAEQLIMRNQEHETTVQAAVEIQKIARGRNDRKKSLEIRKAKLREQVMRVQAQTAAAAAKTIQAGARGLGAHHRAESVIRASVVAKSRERQLEVLSQSRHRATRHAPTAPHTRAHRTHARTHDARSMRCAAAPPQLRSSAAPPPHADRVHTVACRVKQQEELANAPPHDRQDLQAAAAGQAAGQQAPEEDCVSRIGRALLGNCLLLDVVAQDQAGAEASFAAQHPDRVLREEQLAAVAQQTARATTQGTPRTPPPTREPSRAPKTPSRCTSGGGGEHSVSSRMTERVTGILPESLKIALHTRERDDAGIIDDYGDLHHALSPMDAGPSQSHLPGVQALRKGSR